MGTNRVRGDGGTAAVEFALVFPLVATLLFGFVWTGLAYADHIAVNNAVREAARYGASTDATSLTTWRSSVKDRVQQVYANGESSLSDSQICVRLVNGSGTVTELLGADCGSPPSSWPPTIPTGSCVVEVWAQKPRTISLIIFPDMHVDIGGNSIAYYGRTVATHCPAQP
jgi:hypothetical protein